MENVIEAHVVQKVIKMRTVVKTGDETLWWGEVEGEEGERTTKFTICAPCHVFAKDKQDAETKILKACRDSGYKGRNLRMHDSIPGHIGPYEVSVSL